MPMSRRKRILKAIIKGRIRDTFFRSTYERLAEESTHRNDSSADLDVARSRNSSTSSKDFSRYRNGSGHGAKSFSRSASSSGSSKYSSSGSFRRSTRSVIALDPRLLKRNDSSIVRPHEFSRTSSRSDFGRSTSTSTSSKYSINSCSSRDLTRSRSSSGSSRQGFSVVGLENRLLKRSDPINVRRRDRFMNRTDSLVPKRFHVQLGVSTSTSPPLTRENSFGGLNWSKPPPNMKLQHVDSLVIISAKIQPPVRIRDSDKAYAEIAKHRSFKRIDTLRSFKRVDPMRTLKRLESVRAMQPQTVQHRRLKRSRNITRKARLWKAGRGVVHFHMGLGRFQSRRPRDCYIRAMLKAAEDRVGVEREAVAAFDETPTVFNFGPIHVDEIEDEVGFCRNVMLYYHRSVSSVC